PALHLPGSAAEANSNALPGRSAPDPLVAAAEEAIRKAESAETETEPETSGAESEPEAVSESASEPDEFTAAELEYEQEHEPASASSPEAEPETEHEPEPERGFEPDPELERGFESAEALAVPDAPPLPGPYAIGPERHERVADGEPGTVGADLDTFTMRLPRRPGAPATP
ncbi:hypothetical protein GT002_39595, partial [Streptomyces sp. SID4917]|nr:hypothetical protein [Streptomyces sp. SID4917]